MAPRVSAQRVPHRQEERAALKLMVRTLESRAAVDSRVVISAKFAREVAAQLRRLLREG